MGVRKGVKKTVRVKKMGVKKMVRVRKTGEKEVCTIQTVVLYTGSVRHSKPVPNCMCLGTVTANKTA